MLQFRGDHTQNKTQYYWLLLRTTVTKYFIELFENVLSGIRSDFEYYILGDFNIFDKNYNMLKSFQQVLNILNLKQMIIDHTRVTSLPKSFLDHVICSHSDQVSQSGTLPVGLNNHLPVFCSRKLQKQVFNKHRTVNITPGVFITQLMEEDWSNMFTAKNCVEQSLFFS